MRGCCVLVEVALWDQYEEAELFLLIFSWLVWEYAAAWVGPSEFSLANF